jgi:hypothetical protein
VGRGRLFFWGTSFSLGGKGEGNIYWRELSKYEGEIIFLPLLTTAENIPTNKTPPLSTQPWERGFDLIIIYSCLLIFSLSPYSHGERAGVRGSAFIILTKNIEILLKSDYRKLSIQIVSLRKKPLKGLV